MRIKPLPTEAEIQSWVDRLITPETADRDAQVLISILMATANFENPPTYNLVVAAMNRAYSKTAHHENLVRQGMADFINELTSFPAMSETVSEDKEPLIG